jgi:hypothetical protein
MERNITHIWYFFLLDMQEFYKTKTTENTAVINLKAKCVLQGK